MQNTGKLPSQKHPTCKTYINWYIMYLTSTFTQRRLYYAGKNIDATVLQERLLPLIDIMFCEVNPIPVKKACELIGLGKGILRAPLTELEPHHEKDMVRILKEFGFSI